MQNNGFEGGINSLKAKIIGFVHQYTIKVKVFWMNKKVSQHTQQFFCLRTIDLLQIKMTYHVCLFIPNGAITLTKITSNKKISPANHKKKKAAHKSISDQARHLEMADMMDVHFNINLHVRLESIFWVTMQDCKKPNNLCSISIVPQILAPT